MEILMLKSSTGGFFPLNEEEAEKCKRFKIGQTARFNITQMRNSQFHRKWFALAKVAFDLWTENITPQTYKGIAVEPDFDRFRRDLTIMAGFFKPVFAANGEVRLEAESLAFSKMDNDRFEALYSATINVTLQKIIPHANLTEKSLREWVDRTLEFA